MNLLKKLENINRFIVLNILKLIFKNKKINLPIDISKVNTILILRYDAIGDLLVTLNMIDFLYFIKKDLKIDIIVSPRNFLLVKNDKRFRNYYIFSGNKWKYKKELKDIRTNSYDLILSTVFNKTSLAGLIANYISKNAIKVHFLEKKREKLYTVFFNVMIDLEDLRNKKTMLEILVIYVKRLFGINNNYEIPHTILYLCEENKNFAKKYFKNSKRYIVYNISSGNKYREFSVKKNIELLKYLINTKPEFELIIIYAPNDEKIIKLKDELNNQVIFIDSTNNILDIAALIENSEYVITPDTSIVHLSAIYQKKIIYFYSKLASFPNEWTPYNTEYRVLITNNAEPIEQIENQRIFKVFDEFII